MMRNAIWRAALAAAALVLGASAAGAASEGSVVIRVATFNVGDVRTDELKNPAHPRLRALAEVIQRLRPNVLLLNGIAYDVPGAPGVEGDRRGRNGALFVENFLARPQAPGLEPIRYRAFMAPVNSGMPSGFDLDNDGRVVSEYPPPLPGAGAREPSAEALAYANDCWGFGTFPGQGGMALLVDEPLAILDDRVRTFRLLPWDYIEGAFLPEDPATGEPWFDRDEVKLARLSSRSHWDVPVRLPNGAVVHFLCSHPVAPDGADGYRARRHHDEVRFWADYLDQAFYIVDDENRPGGLPSNSHFVILGTLNADPDEGESFKEPMTRTILANRRVNASATPVSDLAVEGLDPDDTTILGRRLDYALPSHGLEVRASGVWRYVPSLSEAGAFPSDHFPVWIEVRVPPPPGTP